MQRAANDVAVQWEPEAAVLGLGGRIWHAEPCGWGFRVKTVAPCGWELAGPGVQISGCRVLSRGPGTGLTALRFKAPGPLNA